VEDWVFQPVVPIAPDARAWSEGPAESPVQIVFWGDYQEPFCGEADAFLRKLAASRTDTRYTFRHYPILAECNPGLPAEAINLHPLACRMARAAEAAGTLGSAAGYWRMHDWLFANQKQFSDETLASAASGLGFDPAALLAAMDSPEVAAEIAADAQAAQAVGIKSIPFIIVNGKLVPRWRMPGVLEAIIEDAAK
jgi:protein-disulfide isomerase